MICIIRFSPLWVVVVVFLSFTSNFKVYIITLLVALLHEAGHMLAAKILKCNILGITIQPFGVCLRLSNDDLNSIKEIIVCVSGPLVNLILIVFGTVLNLYFTKVSDAFFISNFYMLFINLLPVLPLDGGRIFRAVLNEDFGEENTRKIIRYVSIVCVALLLCFGIMLFFKYRLNISLLIIAVFLLDNIDIPNDRIHELTTAYLSDIGSNAAKVFCFSENARIKEVLKIMSYDKFNLIFVINCRGEVVNIITNKFILELVKNNKYNDMLSDVIT